MLVDKADKVIHPDAAKSLYDLCDQHDQPRLHVHEQPHEVLCAWSKYCEYIARFWEELWCGASLLPSMICLPFCKDPQEIVSLRRWHLLSMLSGFSQIGALIVLLMGAFLENMPLLIFGICLKMASYLFGGWVHNASASYLSLWSMQFLDTTTHYQRELRGLLHQQGLTDAEIAALPNLPQELYQTELHNVPNTLLLHFLTPLVSMCVLLLFGEWTISLCIFLLGCAVFPLGHWFYQQFQFGQNRLLRIAQTARAYAAIQRCYTQHLSLTTQVNAVGQLPLFLFTLFILLGFSHTPFAHYLAFTLGLSSLSGLLAFQKTRLHAEQTIKRARHLFSTLAASPFLFTKDALRHHLETKSYPSQASQDIPRIPGIFIHQLRPISMQQIVEMQAVTCFIPDGGVCLMQAPSGYGKSLFLLTLLHLIDHTGDVWFCGEHPYNFHTLPVDTWRLQFAFFREEDFPTSTRIIDLFAPAVRKHFETFWERVASLSSDLAQLVFFGSDVLLEQELSYSNHSKNAKKALFPSQVLQDIKAFRQSRLEWLSTLLQQAYFPCNVHPERVFCTLSRGEQRRLMNFLTIHLAGTSKVRLIILDEPLSHLDAQAIQQQITLLQHTQQRLKVPMLLITHHHAELLIESLENVQLLCM